MRLRDLLVYNDIVIQCHDYPDADTIASGFGIYYFLKNNGKKVRLIYSGAVKIRKPNLLIMIENLGIPIEYVSELDYIPELLITADCIHGEKNVTDFAADTYAAVDHHFSVRNCSELYDIRPEYASCSSVIAVMLREEGIDYNDDSCLATALYYGLYTDSNSMSEISHPADRDLRDFARYMKELLPLLTNSVLSLREIQIAGDALRNINNEEKHSFAVTCARECDPNILGYINDLVLQVDTVNVSVMCCFISGGIKVSVRSCINDIDAMELAKFITDGIGSGGGHRQKAGGFISADKCPYLSPDNIVEFLNRRILTYYESFDVISADSYESDYSDMKKYVKKPQIMGYIRSTDIFEPGVSFRVRSVEADFKVVSDDSMIIMVDSRGSAYLTTSEKFDSTYERTEGIFDVRSDYHPHAISSEMESQPLIFSCCRSRGGAKVYAEELKRNTKLFTMWDRRHYISGMAGDFLVVRIDDPDDIYIIERERFKEIYQQVE